MTSKSNKLCEPCDFIHADNLFTILSNSDEHDDDSINFIDIDSSKLDNPVFKMFNSSNITDTSVA